MRDGHDKYKDVDVGDVEEVEDENQMFKIYVNNE